MNLLLTNDDGIHGEGLIVLASALIKAGHAVTVVAPDYQYNLGAIRPEAEEGENDVQLFRQGFVTITPLLLDQTDHSLLKRWKK